MEAAVYVICYVAGAVVENELVYQPTMKVIGVVATVSFAGVMLTKNIVQNGLIYFTNKLTKTIIWKIIHVIFSIFLLFGPPVQLLVINIGEKGDLIFLILRILMLLFFIVDMTVRCITDDTYFVCTLCKKGDRAANASTSIPRSSDDNSDGMGSTFGIGSFLFWCDLISTVSILYDLSLINKMRYNTITKMSIGAISSICWSGNPGSFGVQGK